jgi:hypothetical protein
MTVRTVFISAATARRAPAKHNLALSSLRVVAGAEKGGSARASRVVTVAFSMTPDAEVAPPSRKNASWR